ncbi:MAG: hypothetical protein JNG90_11720 [Planctomycetaceae bacterium]|nr:hypothetical protein [Planctomycetaceae bacterium]
MASVSALAVVALVVGVLSFLAFVNPVMWFVPLLGLGISLVAIWRVNQYWPELAGGALAWAGLGLALLAGVAAPTQNLVRTSIAAYEAQQYADLFFEYLRKDEPQHAFQMTLESEVRQPFDERLWEKYRASGERTKALREFVDEPTVRALLALGDRAQVRYYERERHERRAAQELFMNVYAVTWTDDAGQKRSFFVRLALVRRRDTNGEMGWYARIGGPIRPPAFALPAPSATAAR